MSSTAIHRAPEPSYQQRSGRALEERTKAMIVAAAEQLMTDRLAERDTEDALAHLTTADICAQARGYLRRDGTEGPIPKATMWKHFKTVEALAAAVADTMTAADRPVPDQVLRLAAGRTSIPPEGVDTRRLEARLAGRHYDLDQLAEQFDRAAAAADHADMLYWAAELAERGLRERRRGDHTRVADARDWARRGLELADPGSRLDCMMGIRCARAAAAAEAVLSRNLDYEPTGLSRIRTIRERELEFAEALGWDLHRLLARFHIEHARALAEEDPRREMHSVYTVARELPALCAPESDRRPEPQDRLQAGELAEIIAALCRVDMAYSRAPEHGAQFAALFGDGVQTLIQDLLACFPATTGERRRHEGNIRALLRLSGFVHRTGRALDPAAVATAVENYRQAAVDLLRTAEYGPLRDLLVAQYLTAKARSLATAESDTNPAAPGAGAAPGSLVHPRPEGLIQAAVQFYDHAARVTSPRGSAGVLRARAAQAGIELRQSIPAPSDPHAAASGVLAGGEFDSIVRAINDLVLIIISRRNRFTDTEVARLLELVDPMYDYITAGRN
ncbi:hypothetical protein [Nocardia carnea]|uniref:Uncharacterized protein n=1 Tax=Nocardia carnea TaxID=37328 RepID=A0ABW7TJX7_9NOCA|nr:hypothetical protein [Nocardia carnea]